MDAEERWYSDRLWCARGTEAQVALSLSLYLQLLRYYSHGPSMQRTVGETPQVWAQAKAMWFRAQQEESLHGNHHVLEQHLLQSQTEKAVSSLTCLLI